MMLVEETLPEAAAMPVAVLRRHLALGSGFELADDPAEDTALAGYLRAAMTTIEGRTGKVLLSQRFRLRLDDWRDRLGQTLPLAPVARVESITLEDDDGHETPLDPQSWRLVQDMQRPVILPTGVILPPVPRRSSVVIRFVAGFSDDWDKVPADLAQAVLMLAARYYEDRSFEGQKAMPFSVSSLIERWRGVRTLIGRGAR